MAQHAEAGQPFDDFVRSRLSKPDGLQNRIYLQPLGEFARGRSPSVDTLKEYATSYFGMDVEVLHVALGKEQDVLGLKHI